MLKLVPGDSVKRIILHSMHLVYYYKSRRKAADAVRALLRSRGRSHVEEAAVFVETEGSVFVAVLFAPGATETDQVRVEGILASGQPSNRDFTDLVTSLKSYREIYIGQGTEMFRGHGWGAARS